MGTNTTESFKEKVIEFFTQHKGDYNYEKDGGDSRVPKADRKGNPRREARVYARDHGEADPYPKDGELDTQNPASSPRES